MHDPTHVTFASVDRFREFQANLATIRTELSHMVNAQDLWDGRMPPDSISRLDQALHDFKELQNSEFGWQDIHGMDEELVARAEEILQRHRYS